MLQLEEVTFAYETKKILKGVTFSVAEGEIVALIGVSGSGKTTLFRLITGLISPLHGTIKINNQPLPKGAEQVTYMRQDDLLLPWRTVLKNLVLFSELGKKKFSFKERLLNEARSLLKMVGLEGIETAYPQELSGGMRQRVSLVRAILQHRPLLLLDEPFASLDLLVREDLYSLLRQIRDRTKKTMIMVTHDFRDAIALADRILILASGKIKKGYCLSKKHETNLQTLTEQIRRDLLKEEVSCE
jgi:ABC-type nitrate/sulfonate/bicarbonate transport system ATPase subunit